MMNQGAHMQVTESNPTFAAIDAADIALVRVISQDRCMPRKDQAAATRKLFRRLGITGLSVTAPNYSMASTVHIGTRDGSYIHHETRAKLLAILNVAFPNHDDRSESMTDYFDSCWSFN